MNQALEALARAMFEAHRTSATGLGFAEHIAEWGDLDHWDRKHWGEAAAASVKFMRGVSQETIESLLTAVYG